MTFDDFDYTRAGALALFLVASACSVASVVSAVSTHAQPHGPAITLADPDIGRPPAAELARNDRGAAASGSPTR